MKKKLIAGALAIGVIFSMSTAITATSGSSQEAGCTSDPYKAYCHPFL